MTAPIPAFSNLQNDDYMTVVTPPPSIGFVPPFTIKRLSNNTFLHNFNPQVMKNTVGVDYYVQSVGGSDGNDGLTPTTPFQNPYTAYAKSDVRTIYFLPGHYGRTRQINNAGPINKNINLIAYGAGVRVTPAELQSSLTWTLDTGTTYKATTAQTVTGVIDRSAMSAWGDALYLSTATTLALCRTTANSWFQTGGVVYVNKQSGTIPDSNTYVFVTATGINLTIEGNCNVYVEGIDFEGGVAPGSANSLAGPLSPTVTCVGCTFRYSTANGWSAVGAAHSYMVNCIASSNTSDGFNYHSSSFDVGNFVEINCRGYRNGIYAGSENTNGSTAHDGVKGVRLNCFYEATFGPVLIDVLTAKTWSVGCEIGGSTAVVGPYGVSTGDNGTEMWLDTCYIHDNAGAAMNSSTGQIYVHNCRYERNRIVFNGNKTIIAY